MELTATHVDGELACTYVQPHSQSSFQCAILNSWPHKGMALGQGQHAYMHNVYTTKLDWPMDDNDRELWLYINL